MVQPAPPGRRRCARPDRAHAAAAALSAALIALASACVQPPGPAAATTAALGEPALDEASGLALSRRDNNTLWLHNDSGGAAVLYALNRAGEPRGRWRLDGVANRDWEDMASFRWRGRAWLMVAEIGDNLGRHRELALHFAAEPARADGGGTLAVHSARFAYPDGPRDAEAAAIDPRSEQVLILSKRDSVPRLYALPLAALFDQPADTLHRAQLLGPLPWDGEPPGTSTLLSDPRRALVHGRATAMDISADGARMAVLGYHHAVILERGAGTDWLAAHHRPLAAHALAQAEALALGEHTLWITSEGAGAPLLQWRCCGGAR